MATYGIDLGTTYCAVARMDPSRGRDPIPVLFDDGGAFPSLVLLAPGNNGPRAVVGHKARAEYARLVGRRFDPPAGVHLIRGAKNHIGRLPEGLEGGPPWVVEGREFTATDVSALILRALRRRVEVQNLPMMERVVVTHPQKFRNLQRLATQQAAEIAGLNLLGILTEPDAAAWAFEHRKPSGGGQKTVVFDFGGGTLDVVLMEAWQDEQGRTQTRVVASDGASCGGLEIDQRICAELIARYVRQVGDDDVDDESMRAQAQDEFMAKAEWIKRALNTAEAVGDADWQDHQKRVAFDNLAGHPPASVDVSLGELSQWVEPVLGRAMDTLRSALRKGNWRSADVDVIRMTGQSSLLVAMRKRLEQEFDPRRVVLDHDPRSFLHPATIVASGAAVFGHTMASEGAAARAAVRGAIPETISFTSRISTAHPPVEVFEGIPAGTATPAHIEKAFTLNVRGVTLPNGGRTLPIEVFEGASRTPIGTYQLTFDKPLEHDEEVVVTLDFARNGRFSMGVRYRGEQREARLAEVDCVLDPGALDERRDLISRMELEV